MLSLIPVSDANPTRRFPAITIGLIALNVVAFLQTPGLGTGEAAGRYFFENAPIPCQVYEGRCLPGMEDPALGGFALSMLFSTFLHGGFLHLAGNMLFLWVFGNNVEDFLSKAKYLFFYLLAGLFASAAHVVWSLKDLPPVMPNESLLVSCFEQVRAGCPSIQPYVPSVGASGAVAAVMGAYLLLFPRARVRVLFMVFFITIVEMSAFAVLVLWFVYQFLIAAAEFAGDVQEVAWMAHVGGFVFGAVAIFLLGGRPQHRYREWRPEWRY